MHLALVLAKKQSKWQGDKTNKPVSHDTVGSMRSLPLWCTVKPPAPWWQARGGSRILVGGAEEFSPQGAWAQNLLKIAWKQHDFEKIIEGSPRPQWRKLEFQLSDCTVQLPDWMYKLQILWVFEGICSGLSSGLGQSVYFPEVLWVYISWRAKGPEGNILSGDWIYFLPQNWRKTKYIPEKIYNICSLLDSFSKVLLSAYTNAILRGSQSFLKLVSGGYAI